MTRKSTYAVIILGVVLLVFISFTGFIVRDIPVYFEWIKKISYLSLATAALLENELKGLSLNHNGIKVSGDDLLGDGPLDDPVVEDTRQQIQNLNNSWVVWVRDDLYHMSKDARYPLVPLKRGRQIVLHRFAWPVDLGPLWIDTRRSCNQFCRSTTPQQFFFGDSVTTSTSASGTMVITWHYIKQNGLLHANVETMRSGSAG